VDARAVAIWNTCATTCSRTGGPSPPHCDGHLANPYTVPAGSGKRHPITALRRAPGRRHSDISVSLRTRRPLHPHRRRPHERAKPVRSRRREGTETDRPFLRHCHRHRRHGRRRSLRHLRHGCRGGRHSLVGVLPPGGLRGPDHFLQLCQTRGPLSHKRRGGGISRPGAGRWGHKRRAEHLHVDRLHHRPGHVRGGFRRLSGDLFTP
jgi:hypothetical protein